MIRSNGSSYPFEKEMSFLQLLRLSVRTKLLSVRKARRQNIRSKKIVIYSNRSSYPFKTIVRRASVPKHFHPSRLRRTCQKISKSCKRCLPSPHEFSRYIFCLTALYTFITFDLYRYKFYPRLRHIQQISRTRLEQVIML